MLDWKYESFLEELSVQSLVKLLSFTCGSVSFYSFDLSDPNCVHDLTHIDQSVARFLCQTDIFHQLFLEFSLRCNELERPRGTITNSTNTAAPNGQATTKLHSNTFHLLSSCFRRMTYEFQHQFFRGGIWTNESNWERGRLCSSAACKLSEGLSLFGL